MPTTFGLGTIAVKAHPLGRLRLSQKANRLAKRSTRSPSLQVTAKGKGGGRRAGNSQRPGGQPSVEKFMPPVDPDNEQFVIYVRSKKGFKAWFPLNVVTGGSTANTLVKGLDSNLSRDMAKKSLTNNIGQAIYKDADQLQEMCRRMPMLKAAKELEYGFMILDKKNPSSMFNPPAESVFVIPPEDETRMPAQKMAEGWQSAANTVKNILGGKNSAD
mmetsp:Transcript_33451/g.79523  ORF Transcript_33451/g.79523 Transcript_33451/m.79523 type:complete len:216 (-) Transcript_33451:97-744(-)